MGTGSHPLILIASKVSRSFCDTSGLSNNQEVREVVSPGFFFRKPPSPGLQSGAPGTQHLQRAPFLACALLGIYGHDLNRGGN